MERTTWYALTIPQVAENLTTSLDKGFSAEEVTRRTEKFGRNVLSPPIRTPVWRRFLAQFENPLVIILLISAAASFLAGRHTDALTILAVTIVNAVIGFIQESKAQSAIDALAKMIKTECSVVRQQDRPLRLDAADLVPGDLVLLSTGDRVPADLRIIEAKNLQINESALTGESLPTEKNIHPVSGEPGLGDRVNLGFSGTLVTSGSGRGIVVETGDNTEFGLINALMNRTEELQTPLMERLERFSKLFGGWVLGFGVLIFVVGLLRGLDKTEMFMAAVSAAVGAIPEGLPAVMTIVLAIGVKNMAAQKAIVRKLPAVETLGSVTVICSDKTGTLTANEMTVQTLITGSGRFHAEGIGFNPKIGHVYSKENDDPAAHPDLKVLLQAGILCNDTHLVSTPNGWVVEGDPTEGALLTISEKTGFNTDDIRKANPRRDVQPFDSARQIMVTLNVSGNQHFLWVKGSAEKVLPMCSHALINGKLQPLVPLEVTHPGAKGSSSGRPLPPSWESNSAKIMEQVEDLAKQGMRVLAFANQMVEESAIPEKLPSLVFLGLQAMIDPPRPEVREALAVCQKAGIRVKMITGDHPATAGAIAQDLGICAAGCAAVTGNELNRLTPDEFLDKAQNISVFARVAPEHNPSLSENGKYGAKLAFFKI